MNDSGKGSPRYCHVFPTAFGVGALVFQQAPFLVERVLLPCEHEAELRKRMEGTGPVTAGSGAEAVAFCRRIQRFFDGIPVVFPWGDLNLTGLTPLQRAVLKTVAEVPYGSTRTYGEIASQIGRPGACRFVGTSLARNPFPVVIPCHRIVRADGSPGGFSGGSALKERMLALESGRSSPSRAF